jgi:hypothetical protein
MKKIDLSEIKSSAELLMILTRHPKLVLEVDLSRLTDYHFLMLVTVKPRLLSQYQVISERAMKLTDIRQIGEVISIFPKMFMRYYYNVLHEKSIEELLILLQYLKRSSHIARLSSLITNKKENK